MTDEALLHALDDAGQHNLLKSLKQQNFFRLQSGEINAISEQVQRRSASTEMREGVLHNK